MKRIDLDDLPPKLAALLTGAEEGEEVLLVLYGEVGCRLPGGAVKPAEASQAEPLLPP
jgi:hypothetical protein